MKRIGTLIAAAALGLGLAVLPPAPGGGMAEAGAKFCAAGGACVQRSAPRRCGKRPAIARTYSAPRSAPPAEAGLLTAVPALLARMLGLAPGAEETEARR